MADKIFIIVSSGDRDVCMLTGFEYPLRAAQNKWMDEIKLIVFGPAEKLVAYDLEIQQRIKEIQSKGVEIIACKPPADKLGVTSILEGLGLRIEYVGPIISQWMKEGWHSMTF